MPLVIARPRPARSTLDQAAGTRRRATWPRRGVSARRSLAVSHGLGRRVRVSGARIPLRAGRAIVTATAAYLGLLTLSAWVARARGQHRTSCPAEPSHRFLVLIPAHDEERLIGATLKSLAELDYPAHL